ncbi:MAG: menaquinone biosynthesis protein [Bacteroidetes bacterium]|nr:menaquinone biosynthesis protein [Bacteroidota bacterium]
MKKIRVSTVKYANSIPLNWGLLNGPVAPLVDIDFDHPTGIAAKIAGGKADIGLLPVAAIPQLEKYHITGDYCIGTRGSVRTVMFLSNSKIEDVGMVWLDHRSVTSVSLAMVLAKYHWKREFKWHQPDETFIYDSIGPGEAVVMIGDQCFGMENRFRYGYDLGHEWNLFTGLPFVFAAWVATIHPGREFIGDFNRSLEKGLKNIRQAVREMNKGGSLPDEEIVGYLSTNIDYEFDEPKKRAMELFLGFLNTLKH